MHISFETPSLSLSLLHGRFMRHLSITEMPNSMHTHSQRSIRMCTYFICTLGFIHIRVRQFFITLNDWRLLERHIDIIQRAHRVPFDKWIAVGFSVVIAPIAIAVYGWRWMLVPLSLLLACCLCILKITPSIYCIHAIYTQCNTLYNFIYASYPSEK